MRVPHPATGYNAPSCFAMYLSQFAHQRYLDGRITFEQYELFQNLAYTIFPPRRGTL